MEIREEITMEGDRGCAMGRIEQMIRYAHWSSGASGFVIGISGGIDSAVAAAFCCRAVGPEKVIGVTLPTSVTRQEDIKDAKDLCSLLGITHMVISIDPILEGYHTLPGYTETPYLSGNLMARTRMAVLYYYANKENRLVCGTSNRTEYLLGYCTKFGDNASDIQPLLHLYKTEIFDIAPDLGIPESIIRKPPSAGLWHGQSDEAEIGLSYPDIDAALKALEKNRWKASTPVQEKVLQMVEKSEHKRMPAPHLYSSG
jgi:NAD+ synthase